MQFTRGFVVSAGIGSIPDAVLRKLTNHRDLGIHSEMFSDGIINLVELGVVTNARKVIQTGKIVGGFAFGTRALYDFMNNNPFVGEEAMHSLSRIVTVTHHGQLSMLLTVAVVNCHCDMSLSTVTVTCHG